MTTAPHPLEFFSKLVWLDSRPLLDTIEPYRRRLFTEALYTFEPDGVPRYNFVLAGKAKKNFKTTDAVLASLYRFLVWPSSQGNDCSLLANDEAQAGDDLSLTKKLIACNPVLTREVTVGAKVITRNDGRGTLDILPAKDVAGSHGKTKLCIAFDEIWAYRNHDLFEALALDPTRLDALMWATSYNSIRHAPGIPLYDFFQRGKAGTDRRMYFSWYAADYTTDPAFVDKTQEECANPSMASWNNPGYLAQQRMRLPTHKYRRLHLNLPGAPDGAAFSADHVMAAIVSGRKHLPFEEDTKYFGFVDMSGGSNDWAWLAIAHYDAGNKCAVLDLLESQTGRPPFSPRAAVKKFAALLKDYGLAKVTGDNYAGPELFKQEYEDNGISYVKSRLSAAEIYDAFEPRLNAGEVELLDIGELQEQLLTLVIRGGKIDHQTGDHDDAANAAAGALCLASPAHKQDVIIACPIIVTGGGSPFASVFGQHYAPRI